MIRLVLASRSCHLLVIAVLALGALSALLDNHTVVIHLSAAHRQNRLAFPELCAVVGVVVAVALLRPRFREWDRLGTHRATVVSVAFALAGMLLPLVILVLGSLRLPDAVPWAWQVSNYLVFAGVAFCLGPLVGPALAGGATLVLYFGAAVVNHLVPRGVLPVTGYPGPATHWAFAALVVLLALVVHGRTRGAGRWSRRLAR
ncbi:hypothetical protein [Actinosynnema sp. NPDC023587]|uniref:hypothetical protein n=1 Tax=Actinosynnema sp. NPDC023587 TaxID=3154695 RepID=UPI0033CA999B